MTVSETPAGTESPLQIRSGAETGSAGTTGPSEPAAGLQTVVDAMHEFIVCEVGWDAGEPMRRQAADSLAALGFTKNITIDALLARLAVSDDDLAALQRLRTCQPVAEVRVTGLESTPEVNSTEVGLLISPRALLAYLRGTQP